MAGSATAIEILDRFLEEAPERIASCHESLTQGDLTAIQHHLHRIRSDAGWLGARQVADLAGEGETRIVEGRPDGLAELFEQLSGLCYEVSQELQRERTLLLGSKEL